MTRRPSSTASPPTSAFASASDLFRGAFAALLLATSILGGCQADAPRPPAKAPETAAGDLSAYRLGIGDRVRIAVYGEPELSMDAEVDPTGHVGYPLLGSIPAQRKTAAELAADLTKRLAGGYLVNPDVRVTVVQYRAFYVTGQVNRAGAYPYTAGLTVEKALALAGGITRLASTRGIYLLREDAPVSERRKVTLDTAILPGDTLFVEESMF